MRNSQFGFRPRRHTSDALFITRRMIDAAVMGRGPGAGLMLLLLDWAKAFDSIRPDSLLEALRRFGLPPGMLQMIRAIYTDRQFVVRDGAHISTCRKRQAGIAQGCPLSPYLFIIVQAVMLRDVDLPLAGVPHIQEPDYVVTPDVFYADDTVLVSAHANRLQQQSFGL
ncbi:unnamed protein product [Polarella glacialis]|uniref:Reverse transcriptase domain-containing protein n=1 Tax=Polarella glacialis TaxID=89957 RepID=A0A813KYN2_POLGL|nr:unnamed protein product [Polarella glacialis]